MCEEIYENLVKGVNPEAPESIHMLDWDIRARDIAQYKLRWPVSDITVVSQDEDVLKAIEELTDIIKDQSNTKDVLCASEFEKLSFNAKPNLKTLGPRLKGDMGKVIKGSLKTG